MTTRVPIRWIVASLVICASPAAGAANLVLLLGHAEARGYSEAADWDTSDGFAFTDTVIGAGGWHDDNACSPGACLDVTTGVATPGGSPNTRSSVDLIPAGTSDYLFPSLSGTVLATADADVGSMGILSEARSHAYGLLLLAVTETTMVTMSGTCGASASGAGSISGCAAIILGSNGQLPLVEVTPCQGGTCDEPIEVEFEMSRGVLYFVALVTVTETSTGSVASASGTLDFALSVLAAE